MKARLENAPRSGRVLFWPSAQAGGGGWARNATVRAKDRVIVLRISKEPFMRMVREFPNMAVFIMQVLAHRVESTNNQLRGALNEVKRLREQAGIAA